MSVPIRIPGEDLIEIPAPVSQDAEAGFLLPMVLIALAIMGLSLWSAASVFDLATRNIRQVRSDIEFERQASSIEARVSYGLASEPMGPAGLRMGGIRVTREQAMGMAALTPEQMSSAAPNYLYLDGRSYRAPALDEAESGKFEPLTVTLQDSAGLVNLDSGNETTIASLLDRFDIDRQDAEELAATLADYTDRDNLRRLEGAEADVYRREGLAPPINGPLRAPYQAFGALGWTSKISLEKRDGLLETAYAARPGAPKNVNTATDLALSAWFGISKEQALKILELRAAAPFMSFFEFVQRSGVRLPEDDLNSYVLPSDTIRLRIRRNGAECGGYEVWVTLARSGDSRPLFFRARQYKSCASFPPAEKASNGFENPYPIGPNLLPSRVRTTDRSGPG